MQIGDTGREINSVLLTTDVTTEVVNEAIERGCQLIISHHPLLFHGLKQICGETAQQRIVETAIRHQIASYSAHTALDSVMGDINTRLADKLGIKNYRILVPSSDEKTGLGVIGTLSSPIRYEEFLTRVRDILDCSYVRYTRAPKEMIERVALCGGSGAEFIPEAIRQGADVYITADCKYHEFQDADGQIGLIDIDHWYSERHAREIFRDILAPLGVQCLVSKTDKTPILIFNPS